MTAVPPILAASPVGADIIRPPVGRLPTQKFLMRITHPAISCGKLGYAKFGVITVSGKLTAYDPPSLVNDMNLLNIPSKHFNI